MKTDIRQIYRNNPKQICFLNYRVKGEKKSFPFFAIEPKTSGFKCDDCGQAVWNASNLSNDIHFCPNRELDIDFSPYKVQN